MIGATSALKVGALVADEEEFCGAPFMAAAERPSHVPVASRKTRLRVAYLLSLMRYTLLL
jgi:hypothetical protein